MAIMDFYSIFSNGQAITAAAASTNTVDVPAYFGYGNRNCLQLVIQEDFNNLTSLTVKWQESNDVFASNTVDLHESYTILAAELKAGNVFAIKLPDNVKQKTVRLYYTPTGTAPTTGKVHAAIVSTDQHWYSDAQKLG